FNISLGDKGHRAPEIVCRWKMGDSENFSSRAADARSRHDAAHTDGRRKGPENGFGLSVSKADASQDNCGSAQTRKFLPGSRNRRRQTDVGNCLVGKVSKIFRQSERGIRPHSVWTGFYRFENGSLAILHRQHGVGGINAEILVSYLSCSDGDP